MSVLSTSVVKSVVLAPGEQFILPPGATLVAASDVGALASSCTLPDLEEYGCYVAMVAAGGEEGSVDQYWEDSSAHITGYRLNGVDHLFPVRYEANDDGIFDGRDAMLLELKASVGGIIAVSSGYSNNAQRGALTYLLIKTVPSIATSLEVLVHSDIVRGDANQDITLRSPFKSLSSLQTTGYIDLPPCP